MFRGWHFPEGVTESRENASPWVKIFDHFLKLSSIYLFIQPDEKTVC
jgi:hypothetical protein